MILLKYALHFFKWPGEGDVLNYLNLQQDETPFLSDGDSESETLS